MRSSRSLLVLFGTAWIGSLLVLGGCGSTKPSVSSTPPVYFPPPPAEPRLQLLATYSKNTDIEPPDSFRKFVTGEELERHIQRAQGVDFHDGRIFVCDPNTPAVVIFDLRQKTMTQLEPKNRTLFATPLDIEITSDGYKYVTDTKHRRVLVFDSQDRYVEAFGDPERWRPVGIAATEDRLYVTDAANHAIVVLDRRSGNELLRFGRKGDGDTGFLFPVSIDVGPDGDLYISDSLNFRVKRTKPDGTFVRSFGSVGRKLGDLARPRGVAVDRKGRFYILDGAFENCQIFNDEGQLLLYFGMSGGAPGAMNLPACVEISYEAVDAFRDRVVGGRELEYVVFVTSQVRPHMLNVYGLLRTPE